jgi:hypothetical protein
MQAASCGPASTGGQVLPARPQTLQLDTEWPKQVPHMKILGLLCRSALYEFLVPVPGHAASAQVQGSSGTDNPVATRLCAVNRNPSGTPASLTSERLCRVISPVHLWLVFELYSVSASVTRQHYWLLWYRFCPKQDEKSASFILQPCFSYLFLQPLMPDRTHRSVRRLHCPWVVNHYRHTALGCNGSC